MQAGTLNRRVTLQAPGTTQDELGQPIPGWTDVATVWASVRHVSGLEAIKSGADVSVVKVSVRIRYLAGIDAGMRVLHGAEVFDIRAVLPDTRRQYVDLICQKVTG